MSARQYRLLDRVLGEINKAINVLYAAPKASQPLPGTAPDAPVLEDAERREASRLMRVNHAGEVAAQALYRGQALVAREPATRALMERSAQEEFDHLAWCAERIDALGGHTSRLNPLWYGGSFVIGALAGLRGDRFSLGFITETEHQVEQHLDSHLERLPVADQRSREVLDRMRHDEIRHGRNASASGGQPLPLPIRLAMRLTSRFMTHGSYWI